MATTETVLHHLVDKRFVGVTPDGMRVMIDGEPTTRPAWARCSWCSTRVAGCAAYDVVEMLRKRKLSVRGYRVEATGERADGTPSPFTKVHTRHVFDVPGLDQRRPSASSSWPSRSTARWRAACTPSRPSRSCSSTTRRRRRDLGPGRRARRGDGTADDA
jgi:putative redox protein